MSKGDWKRPVDPVRFSTNHDGVNWNSKKGGADAIHKGGTKGTPKKAKTERDLS